MKPLLDENGLLQSQASHTRAILRENEDNYINGFGPVMEGAELDYQYDEHDVFYIVINGECFEEPSTAFDFIDVNY